MYFPNPMSASIAIAEMAENIYNKRDVINVSQLEQIKLKFRIFVGHEKEVHLIIIIQDYMVWYTVSEKPYCHMTPEERAALVFEEDETDYTIHARGSRHYIFGDLVRPAVEFAIEKHWNLLADDEKHIAIYDSFPMEKMPRQERICLE